MAIRYHSNLQNCNRWSYDITGFIKHYVIKNKYIIKQGPVLVEVLIVWLVMEKLILQKLLNPKIYMIKTFLAVKH